MNGLSHIESIGHLFYLISPNRTSFEKISDVPRYDENAIPKLYTMFLIEVCLAWYTKRHKIVLNETLANISQVLLFQLFSILVPIAQMTIYEHIYEHYRLVTLPWNSAWTWWIALLMFDFIYYCMHRLAHVVNILWATHHTHHSAEYYNIGTNFRQNIVQVFVLWVFVLPGALFVPLPIFYAHSVFNSLYQFWIHTEFVRSLGPLEYILNTPSHHRVHHGRNRKYIDKNFGGFLIIFDRIFGTFEAENEESVYGVTKPVNSFDIIIIQFQPFIEIWKNFWKYKGIKNKLSVLFKGPGWAPGKPWLGVAEDIPDVKAPQPKYDVQLPLWCKVYVFFQVLVLVSGHYQIVKFNYNIKPDVKMEEISFIESIGHLFYIVSPTQTSFEALNKVPYYIGEAYPNLWLMFFIEICVANYTKRSSIRLNDTIANLSQAMLYQTFAFFAPGGSLLTYGYIYAKWRIVTLPWNSTWTWLLCFLAYDFLYYVGHRAVHSINILWATHHVHHSSEEYNISTQVRQSILQLFSYLWVSHYVMALFIPLPMYFVHLQFSYLYQFWIHTELIKSLGPLEYILNTPSHHRVHHGRNRDCIDKNFAGTLIIWDRMFGTFEAEKNEKIHYGLTDPVDSFDTIKIQFEYLVQIGKTFWKHKGVMNKLSVIFKGPGWSPGMPWLGDFESVPEIKGHVKKYDVHQSLWCKLYVICHFIILIQSHVVLQQLHSFLPNKLSYGLILFEMYSLVSIGYLLDQRSYYSRVEFIRCLLYYVLDYWYNHFSEFSIYSLEGTWLPRTVINMAYMISTSIWLSYFAVEFLKKHNNVFCISPNCFKKVY